MSDSIGIKGLQARLKKIADPEKALKKIGIALVSSTKNRFSNGVDPQGKTWQERSDATKAILAWKKRLGKRTLVVTGDLQKSIGFIATNNNVKIGTNKDYAEILNRGGTSDFTVTRKSGKKVTIKDPVTIPKRQFLGISSTDRQTIQDILDLQMKGRL